MDDLVQQGSETLGQKHRRLFMGKLLRSDDYNNDSDNMSENSNTGLVGSTNRTCGACKFLRRKCLSGCIFVPHFLSDQGAARFAAVHKVFGASNVSKLLTRLPENRRHDAVVTVSYEAQARLSDPVHGCVSTIIALQQQVASLQEELSMVQTQLMNSRYLMENALHHHHNSTQHQTEQAILFHPAYSNASSVSNNNLINNFQKNSGFNFGPGLSETGHSCDSFGLISHLTRTSSPLQDEDEGEEEKTLDLLTLANNIFR